MKPQLHKPTPRERKRKAARISTLLQAKADRVRAQMLRDSKDDNYIDL